MGPDLGVREEFTDGLPHGFGVLSHTTATGAGQGPRDGLGATEGSQLSEGSGPPCVQSHETGLGGGGAATAYLPPWTANRAVAAAGAIGRRSVC